MLLTNQNYIILLTKSQSQFYMIIVSYILKFIISILKIPWKNEETQVVRSNAPIPLVFFCQPADAKLISFSFCSIVSAKIP